MFQALALVLAVTVGFTVAAEARMHHPYRGHRIVQLGQAPLDAFTQPTEAYSFRKLRAAYAGNAVRLRRTTGGELDIGFVGSDFDAASAATFCAATTCFIATWYDQSGNGRHATQVTPASQPAYIASCNGTLPCARTTGAQSMATPSVTPVAGPISYSGVVQRTAGTSAYCAPVLMYGGSANFFSYNTAANSFFAYDGTASIYGVANEGAWHSVQGVLQAGANAAVLNIDGVETTGTVTGNKNAGTGAIAYGAAAHTCNFAEVIHWDAYALTPAERTALTQNQRDYWTPLPLDAFTQPSGAYSFRKLKSTYSGPAVRIRRASDNAEVDIPFLGFTSFTGAPIDTAAAGAHCAATTCSVVTWYDQSGAAKHLTQATAANQPQLVFNCKDTLPCARTTAATQLLNSASAAPATGLVTLSAVGNRSTGTTGACGWFRQNGTVNRLTANTAANWSLFPAGLARAGVTDAAWHVGLGILSPTAGQSVLNIDGTETTGTTVPTTAAGVAGIFGAATTTCDQVEAIFWDNYALTAPERTALVSNQRSFWGF